MRHARVHDMTLLRKVLQLLHGCQCNLCVTKLAEYLDEVLAERGVYRGRRDVSLSETQLPDSEQSEQTSLPL